MAGETCYDAYPPDSLHWQDFNTGTIYMANGHAAWACITFTVFGFNSFVGGCVGLANAFLPDFIGDRLKPNILETLPEHGCLWYLSNTMWGTMWFILGSVNAMPVRVPAVGAVL